MKTFIPVVDLSPITSLVINEYNKKYIDNEILIWDKIAEEIGDAFHEIGFVYLINHGVDSQKIEAAFKDSKIFFEQPLEKKLAFKKENATKGYHGGYSQNSSMQKLSSDIIENINCKTDGSAFELRESYDFAGKMKMKEDEDIDKRFHLSLTNLQDECKIISKIIFKLIGIALKLDDKDFFIKCSRWIDNPEIPSFKTFRSLYYPAIPENVEIPQGKARVKEHVDFSFLTFLFQDTIGGLEVKTANGEWVPAPPIPGSILVNIGDILDLWTGGCFPATKHRVLIPESEIMKRTSRQSIFYFTHPDSNTLVAPLASERLGKYEFKALKAYEHTKGKLALVKSY